MRGEVDERVMGGEGMGGGPRRAPELLQGEDLAQHSRQHPDCPIVKGRTSQP